MDMALAPAGGKRPAAAHYPLLEKRDEPSLLSRAFLNVDSRRVSFDVASRNPNTVADLERERARRLAAEAAARKVREDVARLEAALEAERERRREEQAAHGQTQLKLLEAENQVFAQDLRHMERVRHLEAQNRALQVKNAHATAQLARARQRGGCHYTLDDLRDDDDDGGDGYDDGAQALVVDTDIFVHLSHDSLSSLGRSRCGDSVPDSFSETAPSPREGALMTARQIPSCGGVNPPPWANSPPPTVAAITSALDESGIQSGPMYTPIPISEAI